MHTMQEKASPVGSHRPGQTVVPLPLQLRTFVQPTTCPAICVGPVPLLHLAGPSSFADSSFDMPSSEKPSLIFQANLPQGMCPHHSPIPSVSSHNPFYR